jgi:membrane protein DedA with SNARE-associated domain
VAQFTHLAADFIAAHSTWAALIILVAAFSESLAFLSLVVPGTAILLAAGTLMPRGILPVWPVLIAAAVGAILGDGVSYWIGRRFGDAVHRIWPFTRYPGLIPRGIKFFKRHGQKSVFIGRFFGPVRAVIPLAAGIMGMLPARFWLANIASALVWSPTILFSGAIASELAERIAPEANLAPVAFLVLVILGIGGVWIVFSRQRRKNDEAAD